MPHDARPWYDPLGVLNTQGIAMIFWAVLIAAEFAQVVISPKSHSVYPIYAHAGENWSGGGHVYGDKRKTMGLDFFRYSPTAAAMFAPFGATSLRVGGSLWRLGNMAVLLGGLAYWFRAALPPGLSRAQFGAILLLTWPMTAGSIHNSQSNTLVLGLLLITTAAAAHEWWWLAAATVAFAGVFKVYPLALGLLIAVGFPRPFTWRLATTVMVAGLLPFLMQQPSYVTAQFGEWISFLQADGRHHMSLERGNRDLRFLWRAWGFRFEDSTYQLVELVSAALAAVVLLTTSMRGWSTRRQLGLTLGLGAVWMTLLGPATEACTYLFLGPSLAWGLVRSWCEARRPIFALLACAYVLFFGELVSGVIPGGNAFRHLGVLPFAAILSFVGLVWVELLPPGPSLAIRASSASLELRGLRIDDRKAQGDGAPLMARTVPTKEGSDHV